jgi:diguanylate cyclase (GGDEF)-like protein
MVVIAGSRSGEVIDLAPGQEVIIGRDSPAHLIIADRTVSRSHARVYRRDDEVRVQDLGSRNGTFVCNVRISEQRLEPGDHIQIGGLNVIRFDRGDALEVQYHQSLAKAAVIDPVSRVFNRRHLDERLQAEVSVARRSKAPLSLLIIDIDGFKRLNDEHGHPFGDRVLAALGGLLRSTVRREDTVARIGGDEFVVVARSTPLESACQLAERIRARVEGADCHEGDRRVPLGVSIGVAQLAPDAGATALLEMADRAAYAAKRGGRNRVVALGEDGSPALLAIRT